MFQTQIPDTEMSIQIEGNNVRLLSQGEVVMEHTATYAIDCPWYAGLEGFATYCGDGFRVGAAELGYGDKIIYLYDHRPAFYPLISSALPDKQKLLEEERCDDPGMFSAEGGAREWQQGGNFGYAWNLDCDYCSEWGTAPFPDAGETVEQMNDRITEGLNSFMQAVGGVDFVIHQPEGGEIVAASFRD